MVEFFFWDTNSTTPNFNPGIDNSSGGMLNYADYDYPLSFSFDNYPSDSTSNSTPPSSSWQDIEGINEWVDLGNVKPPE